MMEMILQIPKDEFDAYHRFTDGWLKWVKDLHSLNGKTFKVTQSLMIGQVGDSLSSESLFGYRLEDLALKFPKHWHDNYHCANWIPREWMVEEIAQKICSCDIRVVWDSGHLVGCPEG